MKKINNNSEIFDNYGVYINLVNILSIDRQLLQFYFTVVIHFLRSFAV